jgi:modulator of FtsH protease HflK
MAWNEPGGGNKDPWSGKSGNDQGPPDLDEVVRKLQERLGGLFGGQKPGGDGSSGGGRAFRRPRRSLQRARRRHPHRCPAHRLAGDRHLYRRTRRTRRGDALRTLCRYDRPGPHWHIPAPIESVIKVNVDEISTFSHRAAMLTQDENIVEVELTVQSRIQDAADYLFQDQDPERTLNDATVTVVRVTIGQSKLDYVMTEGRGAVAVTIKQRVQELMDQYRTGLLVTSVNMQPAKPPDQVKSAFDDAIKAREDKERLENQAEAYSNEVLPQARGQAARILADAKAYRDRAIAESEGETARFTAVLEQYSQGPEVTRQRLYLETMEQVFSQNSKVLLDVQDGGNSLLYLPLDQLLKQRQTQPAEPVLSEPVSTLTPPPNSIETAPQRMVDRERRTR